MTSTIASICVMSRALSKSQLRSAVLSIVVVFADFETRLSTTAFPSDGSAASSIRRRGATETVVKSLTSWTVEMALIFLLSSLISEIEIYRLWFPKSSSYSCQMVIVILEFYGNALCEFFDRVPWNWKANGANLYFSCLLLASAKRSESAKAAAHGRLLPAFPAALAFHQFIEMDINAFKRQILP